jgi:hypothetical protein
MGESWTVAKAQAALGEMVFQLLLMADALEGINRAVLGLVPPEPEWEAMLEGEIPPTVAVEVNGCIECIANDYLPQVIEALQHAATVTAAQLRQDYENHQERRR